MKLSLEPSTPFCLSIKEPDTRRDDYPIFEEKKQAFFLFLLLLIKIFICWNGIHNTISSGLPAVIAEPVLVNLCRSRLG